MQRRSALALAFLLLGAAPPRPTFGSPPGPGIAIPDVGPGQPYPSEIEVSGLPSRLDDVNVTLEGLSHTSPEDLDVVLIGPGGQSTVLMSDVGLGFAVSDVRLTLDDEATESLPDAAPITSGTFRPTDSDSIGWDADEMPPPAPTPPVASLTVFVGTDPNGTWQLFVNDDSANNEGTIEGWSLDILTVGSSNAKAREGGTATFRLTRSGRLDQPLSVTYRTVNGTAKGGKDFKKVSGTATFSPGETVKKVKVRTKEDRVAERTERFFLRVTAGGVTATGKGTIKDD
ncbi:MAG: Calx-beta domain-containing protein [Actinomycetota bacterium]